MKILFFILPICISVLIVVVKKKIVNAQNGKKFSYRELILDILRIIAITSVALLANMLYGKNIPVWTLLIDILMLIAYSLPLFQKNYDYIERKAIIGIWSVLVTMIVGSIAIIQMLTGKFDINDTTLLFCYTKGVSYFFIAMWICLTNGKDKKIKGFLSELVLVMKNSELKLTEYYMLAFMELFVFCGGNGYIPPFGIFGFHELINKKVLKGVLYIISGNICLFLMSKLPLIGQIVFVVYTLTAIADMVIKAFKYIKNQANPNQPTGN